MEDEKQENAVEEAACECACHEDCETVEAHEEEVEKGE